MQHETQAALHTPSELPGLPACIFGRRYRGTVDQHIADYDEVRAMPKKRQDRKTGKEGIYTILSIAILFPWVVWLIINLPPLPMVFAA